MKRILVPVDGSEKGLQAVRAAIAESRPAVDRIELVHVQPGLPRHAARFAPRRSRDEWRRERAARALAPARRLVEGAGIDCGTHAFVGPTVRVIDECARRLRASEIVLGATRRGPFASFLHNSVSARLLESASVPVRVVPAARAPAFERVAIPLGIGMALLVLAAED